MRITLAILNTLLAIALGWIGISLTVEWPRTWDISTYNNLIIIPVILAVGVVSGWVVALSPPGVVSPWWKILSFAVVFSMPLFLVLGSVVFQIELLLGVATR